METALHNLPRPEQAVLAGAGDLTGQRLAHGSTVATNALLERRGPRTVLVTTEGFRDLLVIRRQGAPQPSTTSNPAASLTWWRSRRRHHRP